MLYNSILYIHMLQVENIVIFVVLYSVLRIFSTWLERVSTWFFQSHNSKILIVNEKFPAFRELAGLFSGACARAHHHAFVIFFKLVRLIFPTWLISKHCRCCCCCCCCNIDIHRFCFSITNFCVCTYMLGYAHLDREPSSFFSANPPTTLQPLSFVSSSHARSSSFLSSSVSTVILPALAPSTLANVLLVCFYTVNKTRLLAAWEALIHAIWISHTIQDLPLFCNIWYAGWFDLIFSTKDLT